MFGASPLKLDPGREPNGPSSTHDSFVRSVWSGSQQLIYEMLLTMDPVRIGPGTDCACRPNPSLGGLRSGAPQTKAGVRGVWGGGSPPRYGVVLIVEFEIRTGPIVSTGAQRQIDWPKDPTCCSAGSRVAFARYVP
jgi:hypothetical protein